MSAQVLWLVVPEGNGKTTLMAALGLYGLRFGGESSIPVAASTRDQAKIMYRQMKGFVTRSGLSNPDAEGFWFECFDGYRQVQLRRPGKTKRGEVVGQIEIHAADAGTADGVIPWPLGFLDELHRHKDLSLARTWTGKLNKRRGSPIFTLKHFEEWCSHLVLDSGALAKFEPFQLLFVKDVFAGWDEEEQGARLVVISTAGEPGHEFETTREKIKTDATAVIDKGAFCRYSTDQVILHDWSVRNVDDILKAKAVKAANPLSTVTIKLLKEKLADPTMTETHWRRFTCNIATRDEGKEPFIDLDDWDGLADPSSSVGPNAYIGADGSRTWDTTVVAWASQDENGMVDVDARVFSVRKDIACHVLHERGKIDFDDVESFVLDLFDQFEVEEAAYDPRYLDRSMDIVAARLPDPLIFPVEPSSKEMRVALQAMFNLATERRLRHRGDPVLRQHVANAGADRGLAGDPSVAGGELRRVRRLDGRLPIDAVPAMALAVWRASSVIANTEPIVMAF
jgi:phage terminase large subunit-like protein